MNVERIFIGNKSFVDLFLPLVEFEMDRIIEESQETRYNEGIAATPHSEGDGKL